MTPDDLRPFVRLLEERIGLDAASIGHDEVGRAVRRRVGATGAAERGRPLDAPAYYRRLLADQDEWDEFVEHVLVPETWFFREPTAFEVLTRVTAERLRTGRPCRVLSLPCATGEEPYSMAIALHEAGLSTGAVSIDALDISRRALDAAAAGVYSGRAVRYVGEERLGRYFAMEENGHRVGAAIKAAVSFGRANLVEDRVLAGRGRYDLIFCRNVLIYFSEAARARVLATLEAALVDDGWLVTGHAEGSGVVAPRFVSARVPRTFAFRKATLPGAARESAAADSGRAVRPPVVTRKAQDWAASARPAAAGAARARVTTTPARAKATAPRRETRAIVPSLAEIERLADAGDVTRAAESCRAYLAAHPASSHAHYLLGLVESARGARDAADVALRRAIYLDPSNVAALVHLAGERRKAGDTTEATQLMRRADLVRARQQAANGHEGGQGR